ncbi:MAG: transposase family protein [Elusimicrobiales bacterium]|nr:transposase family protein [Elusimicrobiales bacterium]MCK5584356.1 transposase family protein [Elusimicrobiales bacterium]
MDYKFRMKYLKQIIDRYHKLDKSGKNKILDEAVKICGYKRKYLISLLNKSFTQEKALGIIKGRGRKKIYDSDVERLVKNIWIKAKYPWSVRLKEIIKDWMYWSKQEYEINPRFEKLLLNISSSTLDRMLKRHKHLLKNRIYGKTKPGSLLKREIPVMTEFHDIDEPGHLEIDLVSHSGPNASGQFIYTLNTVDIYSGWDEAMAVMGKGEEGVKRALIEIIKALPFSVKSIDSDNGGEFINWQLYNYCKNRDITFTRSRPYKKDDNAHIEQKNWTHARKQLGWNRYDSEKSLNLINSLYRKEERLFMNLFQPSVKLIKRERVGSKTKKIYDKPKTPFERLKEKYPNDRKIKKLEKMRASLNPFKLSEVVDNKLDLIWETANRKMKSDISVKNLKQEDIMKEVEKLLKKEAVHG